MNASHANPGDAPWTEFVPQDVDTAAWRVLREVNDRVGFVFELLLSQLNARHADGGLWVPPPILSRTHQVLSDGTAAAMQARKVSYVAFPFPLRQLLVLLRGAVGRGVIEQVRQATVRAFERLPQVAPTGGPAAGRRRSLELVPP